VSARLSLGPSVPVLSFEELQNKRTFDTLCEGWRTKPWMVRGRHSGKMQFNCVVKLTQPQADTLNTTVGTGKVSCPFRSLTSCLGASSHFDALLSDTPNCYCRLAVGHRGLARRSTQPMWRGKDAYKCCGVQRRNTKSAWVWRNGNKCTMLTCTGTFLCLT
jgi:hypothetical protein